MNILTHLQIGDNVSGLYNREYLVVEASVHFFRGDDGFNPDSLARCRSLDLTVVAPSKKDLFFQDWFFSSVCHSGRVLFELAEITSGGDFTTERKLLFSDARCFHFTERYDIHENSLRYYDVKLKLGECIIDEIPFGNGSF